jgi:hypothetical protein
MSVTAALAAAYLAGMAILAIAHVIETSGQLIEGAQDLLDDGADVPFSEPHEAHVREAIAIANDEPDPVFVARTRDLVVDELARRRAGRS